MSPTMRKHFRNTRCADQAKRAAGTYDDVLVNALQNLQRDGFELLGEVLPPLQHFCLSPGPAQTHLSCMVAPHHCPGPAWLVYGSAAADHAECRC